MHTFTFLRAAILGSTLTAAALLTPASRVVPTSNGFSLSSVGGNTRNSGCNQPGAMGYKSPTNAVAFPRKKRPT